MAALEALGAQSAVALERAALADDLLRRRSDERMAAIVQHASDVITVLDANLIVQHQTASGDYFLGYRPAALAGPPFLDLVHPEDVMDAQPSRRPPDPRRSPARDRVPAAQR